MNETVAVITVCLNSSATIDDTLQSFLKQSVHADEYIFIDGASSDDTCRKIQEIGLPNLTLISEPDRGIYDAMNKGILAAKSSYIMHVNSDDQLYSVDTIKEIKHGLKQRDPNEILAHQVLFLPSNKLYRVKKDQDINFYLGNFPPHTGVVFPTNLIAKVQYSLNFKICSDIKAMFLIRALGYRFKMVDRISTVMYSGGVSNSSLKNRLIVALEKIKIVYFGC